MRSRVTSVLVSNAKLFMGFGGLFLIAASMTFNLAFLKIQLDHLVAEVGALLFVLAVLHFMFEFRLRNEMLRDVCSIAGGSLRVYDSGIVDCLANSREVKEPEHWTYSDRLVLGLQYSPKFVEDFIETLEKRCNASKTSLVLLMKPDTAAHKYLKDSRTGFAKVAEGVERIQNLLHDIDKDRGLIKISFHDRVLRYTFILTNEFVWIKMFTNSSMRTTVPAFKVRCNTPLYEFFQRDIEKLIESANEVAAT